MSRLEEDENLIIEHIRPLRAENAALRGWQELAADIIEHYVCEFGCFFCKGETSHAADCRLAKLLASAKEKS